MIELLFLGAAVGVLSGFFGIGGGTILVPSLLLMGYDMKVAIGVSVVQMVFSSIYGSFLNLRRGTLDIKMVLMIGFGGFAGALLSPYVIKTLSSTTLEGIFLLFVLFALARMFFNTTEHRDERSAHPIILFLVGAVLGAFAISIGVGGSLLLVPLLIGFLHVPLKKAVSAGLFFVVFSSLSGLVGLSIAGNIDYQSGVIIGLASLVGVAGGIGLKHHVSDRHHKTSLMVFYVGVSAYILYRLVGQNG
ncbi:MAG: sulfite exporter TauE/SafE family protein [Thiovulaceae bacterium]|nr:sulfite exporter TauE/SafE family protein [Sulfurimonadaceae bacterium]